MKLIRDDNAMSSPKEIMLTLVVVLLGLALTPVVKSFANSSADAFGASTAVGTLVGTVVPLVWVVGIIVAGIAFVSRK